MRNIWLISDTHFNHSNILKFNDNRGEPIRGSLFESVEEMDEVMIDNWNSVVKPGDKIYHLGDVLFGKDKESWLEANMPRLNGHKRLVLGNHDNPKLLGKYFNKIMMWRNFSEYGLLLTHVPVHPASLKEKRFGEGKMVNVHGHYHQVPSPEGPYVNVSVEQIDYTPVHIEELRVDYENDNSC